MFTDYRHFRLTKQCEELADLTPPTGVCPVIIQLDASDEVERYLSVSGKIMEQRTALVSARQLLPNPRTAARKTGRDWRVSRAQKAQMTPGDLAMFSTTRAQVQKVGTQKTLQVLKEAFVREIRGKRPHEPKMFWSSGSIAMELTREELTELPSRLSMVADVFPNREVRLPPVSRSTTARPAINDYRGYTWGGALACWGAYDAEGAVGGKSVLVAVLDTGVDPKHPEFLDEHGRSKLPATQNSTAAGGL